MALRNGWHDMLTQARLKELLSYDPDTGIFTRLAYAGPAKPGDVAGGLNHGYVVIRVGGQQYLAHRLAFLYMTGSLPSEDTDHINGNKSDNRWSNLRLATRSQNQANKKLNSYNTSGINGVCWSSSHKRWGVRVSKAGCRHFLGYYKDKDVAISIAREAAKRLHGEFYREALPA